jgi:hypothetical protein
VEKKKNSVMDGRIDPDRDIYAIPSQVIPPFFLLF